MLFPTASFAIFFTLVFAGAWALREKNIARKTLLLIASFVFYGWWDWRFCFLLLAASLIAWGAGIAHLNGRSERQAKWVTGLSVAVLLTILGFFKYYGFFLESLQELLIVTGLQRDLPFLEIVLPVGISFFTFQAISYVVDVHRGQVQARKSPLDVLLYISLFPQLVAGPIVRAADFLPQLERRAQLDRAAISMGLILIVSGLFKKMVIANYLATDIADPVFLDPGSYSSVMLLLGVYAYAVQIYCDFSGYSDIAIGTAALLGFQFRENFNQPYRATLLQDFWRRWHMSLSQWLRDYLYIPLGGSRFGSLKTYRNLFLTMFLGGLWHGAAWNFVIWGSLHGGWLAMERLTMRGRTPAAWLGKLVGWFITFHIVCAAWVFFRAADFPTAMDWFAGLGAFSMDISELTWFTLALIFVPLSMQFAPTTLPGRLAALLQQKPILVSTLLFVFSILVIEWVAPAGTAPFIYFQF